jgi:hypothetical protein
MFDFSTKYNLKLLEVQIVGAQFQELDEASQVDKAQIKGFLKL